MHPLTIPPEQLRGTGTGLKIAVMTGGGDAQGMNAALRAVIRTAHFAGAQPYAIAEGYQGMVDGGDGIRPMTWDDASGILGKGGTVIGTFRSPDFRERPGRLKAALNLATTGIDRLVVIGGDGTLTGLDVFAHEWPDLLAELVGDGRLTQEQADAHPALLFAGMVGSIDNDLVGTDITIGVDSALHRIQYAIDAIASTAASHQRCFVVEVMGRHCGYLALAAAISGDCDYVLIPELPPAPGWEDVMIAQLHASRQAGRKDTIVILAEGATTRDGQIITPEYVRTTIEEGLNEETRVTILGHVQRGGTPSAYDRWASTWLGYAATAHVLTAPPDAPGPVFGFHGEQCVSFPLVASVEQTRSVPDLIAKGEYSQAMHLRGAEFEDLQRIFTELSVITTTPNSPHAPRIGIMHAGALAPGMNTAAKTATWLGISRGYSMVGIRDGFVGLAGGDTVDLTWSDADGWNQDGGAFLGTRRHEPTLEELYSISRTLEEARISALLVIGGWTAYHAVATLLAERSRYPALQIPIVCLPATLDNNLPGTAMAVGADTALNVVVDCIDKVKTSAQASKRCFVIETMGRDCGYLALMGGLAGGAEQVYLNETGVTLAALNRDIDWVKNSFDTHSRKLFLAVRNENANANYTTDVMARLLGEEGRGRYDTRTMLIGHLQQGGSPTPYDRLLATRLADAAMTTLASDLDAGRRTIQCVGTDSTGITLTSLDDAMDACDIEHQRPANQWWLGLVDLIGCLNREP